MKIGPKSSQAAHLAAPKKQVSAAEMLRMRDKVIKLAERLTPPMHSTQKAPNTRAAKTLAAHAGKAATKVFKRSKG